MRSTRKKRRAVPKSRLSQGNASRKDIYATKRSDRHCSHACKWSGHLDLQAPAASPLCCSSSTQSSDSPLRPIPPSNKESRRLENLRLKRRSNRYITGFTVIDIQVPLPLYRLSLLLKASNGGQGGQVGGSVQTKDSSIDRRSVLCSWINTMSPP